jgi:hypothetical protein
MSFCLTCEKEPWAMCVSERTVNLEPLVNGTEARALRIRYSFESEEPAKTLVNLYYSIDHGEGAEKQTFRRYYRLLGVGDLPGTYTHVLTPDSGCFSAPYVPTGQKALDCQGSNDQCPGCRGGDTCGSPIGKDCAALNFGAAQLQVAADWLPCDGEFRGALRIHALSYGPLTCEEP